MKKNEGQWRQDAGAMLSFSFSCIVIFLTLALLELSMVQGLHWK